MRGGGVMLIVLGGLVAAVPARAAAECRTVDVDFLPADSPHADPGRRMPLQIVAWVEDRAGAYVDTLFLTAATGTHGLGNRPGRFDFNSGPGWPYGRRITVFPVWSRRHGIEFPELVFQSGSDSNLSHAARESSRDPYYCRPYQRSEEAWDAGSCASVAATDKGTFSASTTGYPPRQDFPPNPEIDSADAQMFGLLNPFDAVSRATPPGGVPAAFGWPVPRELPAGDYVLWLEVSREFDHNVSYSEQAYPAPPGIPWAEFGLPYRGQPSILYRVPFTLGASDTVATARDYAGYGDPDGLDGNVRAPDGTITTGVPGSGAARLALVPGGDYRVRVVARQVPDFGPPAAIRQMDVQATHREVTLAFLAPGDDGLEGQVRTYEVRYALGAMTEDSFAAGVAVEPTGELVGPGELQTLSVDKLLPKTDYAIGVRAIDDCGNAGPLTIVQARTEERPIGEVDACFVATAAYGSLLAADVQPLRDLRDRVLRKTVLGELAVEAYYTFGPALAGVIGESELLRATARAVLAPIVRTARVCRF